LDLDRLTGAAAFSAAIGGKTYEFGALTLEAEGQLQAWVKANHPHPLEAVKPHLAGLDAGDRAELLDRARKEAATWPPQVGTQAGAVALLSTQPGQEEVLFHALRLWQPFVTRDDARQVYRQLLRDAAAFGRKESAAAKREAREPREFDLVRKIFAVAFDTYDPSEGDDGGDAPKA
jgi:hypothetical protein